MGQRKSRTPPVTITPRAPLVATSTLQSWWQTIFVPRSIHESRIAGLGPNNNAPRTTNSPRNSTMTPTVDTNTLKADWSDTFDGLSNNHGYMSQLKVPMLFQMRRIKRSLVAADFISARTSSNVLLMNCLLFPALCHVICAFWGISCFSGKPFDARYFNHLHRVRKE